MKMRILFYVEPVAFNGDPKFLSPIMNLIRCMINANQCSDVEYGIAATPLLLEEYNSWLRFGGTISVYRKYLSEYELLSDFDFSQDRYANFLFYGEGEAGHLVRYIDDIISEFSPDVIISFTQNQLIEAMSGSILTLFCERGPLPRWNGRDNFYFDCFGLQRNSILSSRTSEIKAFGLAEYDALLALEEFIARYEAMPAKLDANIAFREWIERHRNGRHVAMIANQPHDSLLVRGATRGVGLETFMMQTLAALPANWMAFGTYHANMGDCSNLDDRLAHEFPNYVGLPPELRQFGSDPFSDAVDGVITIGSKAALVAALLGKKVIANPNTMFAGLASSDVAAINEASTLTPLEAGRILAFLAMRYTIPNEDLFERNGLWLERVRKLRERSDDRALVTELADWHVGAVGRLFGASV